MHLWISKTGFGYLTFFWIWRCVPRLSLLILLHLPLGVWTQFDSSLVSWQYNTAFCWVYQQLMTSFTQREIQKLCAPYHTNISIHLQIIHVLSLVIEPVVRMTWKLALLIISLPPRSLQMATNNLCFSPIIETDVKLSWKLLIFPHNTNTHTQLYTVTFNLKLN